MTSFKEDAFVSQGTLGLIALKCPVQMIVRIKEIVLSVDVSALMALLGLIVR